MSSDGQQINPMASVQVCPVLQKRQVRVKLEKSEFGRADNKNTQRLYLFDILHDISLAINNYIEIQPIKNRIFYQIF
jgi:hypothetical protein